jgi:hypothetical protein
MDFIVHYLHLHLTGLTLRYYDEPNCCICTRKDMCRYSCAQSTLMPKEMFSYCCWGHRFLSVPQSSTRAVGLFTVNTAVAPRITMVGTAPTFNKVDLNTNPVEAVQLGA